MNLANDTEVVESDCIPLELSFDGQTCSFALAPDETRAIAVGSLLGADLRIDRPGVAPVQFHIERENDQLWIIPAYDSAELRINAVRIGGPMSLDTRAVIEFCGVRLTAKVVDLTHSLEPISSALLRQTSWEVPRDRVKIFEERPLGAVGNASSNVAPPIDGELPTTAFQRFVVPPILSEEQGTTRYPVFSRPVAVGSECPSAIPPLRDIGLGEVITPARIRAVGESSMTRQTAVLAATRPQNEASSLAQSQETWRFVPVQRPTTPPYEARVPIEVSGSYSAKSRVMRLLARLGLIESRPALMLLGGAAAAFVLSAIIGWFTRHEEHSISPASVNQFDTPRTNLRNSPR